MVATVRPSNTILFQLLSYNVKWRNRKYMSSYVLYWHSDDIGSQDPRRG